MCKLWIENKLSAEVYDPLNPNQLDRSTERMIVFEYDQIDSFKKNLKTVTIVDDLRLKSKDHKKFLLRTSRL